MGSSEHELTSRLRAAGCVFAEEEAALLRAEADSPATLEAMVARRVAGEPLEQILGWAEFDGLRIRVRPGVFVPRQRSLLLVRTAADRLDGVRRPVVLDLGCGTGALGAAVQARVPAAEVHAVDLDPDAVACARLNLPPDRVHRGDLFAALPDPGLRFDVILANVPYVPTDEIGMMPPEARDHEHRVALDGGPDGLEIQRRVIGEAWRRLRAGGALLIESGARQAVLTASLMRSARLVPGILRDAELDATAVIGKVVHPPPVDDLRGGDGRPAGV
jgi:release factor glutamine methyltransferase